MEILITLPIALRLQLLIKKKFTLNFFSLFLKPSEVEWTASNLIAAHPLLKGRQIFPSSTGSKLNNVLINS